MERKLNILVCPLDCGLEYASRDIPVIRKFIGRGHNVIVAGGKYSLELICKEVPGIEYIPFAGIKKVPTSFLFFKLLPKLIFSIRKERRRLKKIIKDKNIDVVISDNRFGLWGKNPYSIYITHQVMIKMPEELSFVEYLVYLINRFFIYKYKRCWIPDNETMPYLAGDLSHRYSLNGKTAYVGLLSRFSECPENKNNEFVEPFEVMAIVSGPEPHRTTFEQLLLAQMQKLSCRCLLVKGVPEKIQTREQINNVLIYSHLETCQMKQAIQNSDNLICRADYSIIMDLIALRKTGIIVPAPGHTEQEYLAEFYTFRKLFVIIKQEDFEITDALARISVYSWAFINPEKNLLQKEIEKVEKEFLTN